MQNPNSRNESRQVVVSLQVTDIDSFHDVSGTSDVIADDLALWSASRS